MAAPHFIGLVWAFHCGMSAVKCPITGNALPLWADSV